MGIYKAEAIVLRSMVYKEADRILTLFTREEGKVSAVARGVRKTTSRLRGAVQLSAIPIWFFTVVEAWILFLRGMLRSIFPTWNRIWSASVQPATVLSW
jgi:hypothetical protein